MRNTVLVAGLVLAGTITASAAPRPTDHAQARPAATATIPSPRTTGSLGPTAVQGLDLGGDRANWGRRGSGLPSPINPLGYSGE
ncbi:MULTISPECIES: hypothetical protein [unclassified Methylobacterium]|jgi:hypothetical protein|uniref:hypothetical protein n=1 Tax=unclassified Methylobacterium TaxID=2615210 RepID=UPI00136FE69D|nr:hypothetical protein [Methylobacterium sp. 2A]